MRYQLYLAGLAAIMVSGVRCSQAAQTRQSSVGEALATANASGSTPGSGNALPNNGSNVSTDPNGTGTNAGTGNGGGTGGTTTNTNPPAGTGTIGASTGTGTTVATGSKSLEQCQAAGQAWRAVVAGGTQPSDCQGTLVSWCCTRDEVKAHFPTMAAELESRFVHYIDTDKEVLYACSVDASNAYSFSMAKIVGGTTTYDVITITGVIPIVPTQSTPASSPSCSAPKTTSALVKLSLNLDSPNESSGK